MVFRRGNIGDLKPFYSFFKKTISKNFPDYSAGSVAYIIDFALPEKFLETQLKENKKHLILCLDGGKIVGYLLFHQQLAGVSFANWLAVDSAYQRKGIASKLISIWEKEALTAGSHALQLWTSNHNIDFYNKRGFILAGKFPKAWHGHDSYLFYRPIAEPKEENYLKTYFDSKET